MNADAVIELLASLGRTTPALPNAACRNHTDLFDREDPDGIAEAVAICRRCPELAACQRWPASMNPNKLNGVIAGRRYIPDHKKGATA